MNRRILKTTVVTAALFGLSFGSITWLRPAPRLIWNASASVPTGLYRIDVGARPRLGELVAITPPPMLAAWLDDRRYLPRGVPLLKHVAALPGALVCRSGSFVTIDGVGAARAHVRDRTGRPLPVWTGCRTVARRELFLLNAAPDSLDGRYFGPVPSAGLLGTAHPLLVRSAPGAPLRWRPDGDVRATHPTEEEPRS